MATMKRADYGGGPGGRTTGRASSRRTAAGRTGSRKGGDNGGENGGARVAASEWPYSGGYWPPGWYICANE